MPKFSMWWLFLTVFALTIGGIQSLGWWTRPVAAQAPKAMSPGMDQGTALVRHQKCEATHWRSMFMQQ